ncbi:ScbR family autoregulator-binding transcription factor [Streptomyces solaniscabiei]|uniref:ScbR family autoregulator-binding transcription factor n=1 Tax=Streptomyces solaniscabiei TaxID=2683255 RepID=UPI001CE3B330|nr:ScbR family autoregulator-binding transcription factor [Streptomyces solaniscabiei]
MAKQKRALRTREALITSAATVFDRDGFSVASLTAISSLAGVSNGALHFHFANKAALADSVEQAAAERLERIVAAHEGAGGNSLQLLVNASHDLARLLADDVVLRAGFELGRDQVRGGGQGLHHQWHEWVGAALKRADGEGALSEVAPEAVAASVVAATTGFEVLGTQDPQWLSHGTITRFWQLLLPRLAAADVLGDLVPGGSRSR